MDAEGCAEWAIQAIEQMKGKRPWNELNLIVMDTCPA